MTGAGCRVDWVPRFDGNPAAPYIQPVIPAASDATTAVTQGHIRTSDHLIPAEP